MGRKDMFCGFFLVSKLCQDSSGAVEKLMRWSRNFRWGDTKFADEQHKTPCFTLLLLPTRVCVSRVSRMAFPERLVKIKEKRDAW